MFNKLAAGGAKWRFAALAVMVGLVILLVASYVHALNSHPPAGLVLPPVPQVASYPIPEVPEGHYSGVSATVLPNGLPGPQVGGL